MTGPTAGRLFDAEFLSVMALKQIANTVVDAAQLGPKGKK